MLPHLGLVGFAYVSKEYLFYPWIQPQLGQRSQGDPCCTQGQSGGAQVDITRQVHVNTMMWFG